MRIGTPEQPPTKKENSMPMKATTDAEDPQSRRVTHATNCGPGGEFTACSVDITEWAANGSPNRAVGIEKSITCPECVEAIEQWFNHFEKIKGKWYEK